LINIDVGYSDLIARFDVFVGHDVDLSIVWEGGPAIRFAGVPDLGSWL
jgi:hypothetical protein